MLPLPDPEELDPLELPELDALLPLAVGPELLDPVVAVPLELEAPAPLPLAVEPEVLDPVVPVLLELAAVEPLETEPDPVFAVPTDPEDPELEAVPVDELVAAALEPLEDVDPDEPPEPELEVPELLELLATDDELAPDDVDAPELIVAELPPPEALEVPVVPVVALATVPPPEVVVPLEPDPHPHAARSTARAPTVREPESIVTGPYHVSLGSGSD